MDAKRDLQISKALKVGSLPRGLKKLKDSPLYKRNISGWVTLQPGTELRPVSFNKRQQNEETFSRNIHGARMFPSFPYGKQSVFIFEMQIMLMLHGREF